MLSEKLLVRSAQHGKDLVRREKKRGGKETQIESGISRLWKGKSKPCDIEDAISSFHSSIGSESDSLGVSLSRSVIASRQRCLFVGSLSLANCSSSGVVWLGGMCTTNATMALLADSDITTFRTQVNFSSNGINLSVTLAKSALRVAASLAKALLASLMIEERRSFNWVRK